MRRTVVAAIVLCIVALALNTFWVDSKTRAASPRDGGQIVETSVVPANVKADGTGPPVVFLHGFGAALDWWDDIASDLVTDHRIIRIDLIGHGGTEAPSSGYAIQRQAALVSAILDKLSVDRATVIGHSMGGEVATALAELKPERIQRLIFIDVPPTVGNTFSILGMHISPRSSGSSCLISIATRPFAADWRKDLLPGLRYRKTLSPI